MDNIKVFWDIEQRSQDWFDIKHGMMSGTGSNDLIGAPAARLKYIKAKAVEAMRLPIFAEDAGPMSADMRRGMELEPYAVKAINERFKTTNKECGFIQITSHFGLSPDWVNADLTVGMEIKCLQVNAMAEVILSEETDPLLIIPKKHRGQVLSYFLPPTIQKVAYVIFCPAEENASGQDYLHFTWLRRENYLSEIADLHNKIVVAGTQISQYRKRIM